MVRSTRESVVPSQARRRVVLGLLAVYVGLTLPFDLPRSATVTDLQDGMRPVAEFIGTDHSFHFFEGVRGSSSWLSAEIVLADGTVVVDPLTLPSNLLGTYGNTDRFLLRMAGSSESAVEMRPALARWIARGHDDAVSVRLVRRTVSLEGEETVTVLHTEEIG